MGRPEGRRGACSGLLLTTAPLDAAYRFRVNALVRLIDALDSETRAVAGLQRVEFTGHPAFLAIQALPGVGLVLATIFVAEIGDVHRVRRRRALCSWAGLTPRHLESDTIVRQGPITKQAVLWCAGRDRSGSGQPQRRQAERNGHGDRRAARPQASPPSQWPANCSPSSTTACATATSAPCNRRDSHRTANTNISGGKRSWRSTKEPAGTGAGTDGPSPAESARSCCGSMQRSRPPCRAGVAAI
jgi:hypothetical protein